ncbi:PREDICTED: protein RUFY3-like, partial [Priapulus caudatus]|uniref:Protein RUFY3-like n=1 Tax=Priapulus caudatus TaxID=37621 RepID=A0ABM1F200_PRICU
DYYDADAFMCCDEGMIFSGLLVGLNIIDCNFCLKEEDLDYQLGVIDFSLYLKDSIVQQGPLKAGGALCEAGDQTPGGAAAVADPASMTAVLDQKNYIEELNRHLNLKSTFLCFLDDVQECQGSLQHKTELVAKLEHKTNQMAATITNMEQRWQHYKIL